MYEVQSTMYQVLHSGNWMVVVFFIQKSKFGIFNSVFRLPAVAGTSYFLLCTLYYFPNSILTELMQ
jgi:hypothetical protein